MKLAIVAVALGVVALAAPPAVADHGDPTHGVVPHSVGDQPLDIHPVAISTPHPYPDGETYTWEVTVDGASSLAVHLERYEVNGFYSSFSQTCFGSLVRILDAATGLELDAYCGRTHIATRTFIRTNDFWTDDFPTDRITIEFATSGSGERFYGFDVYEVAANGARPVVSVPYSAGADVFANHTVRYTLDPFAPEDTTANVRVQARASYGQARADNDTRAEYGSFFVCEFICTEVEGLRTLQSVEFDVAGHSLVLDVLVFLPKDESSPTGFGDPQVSVACEIDEAPCG